MRFPRLTTRRLMALVAVVGVLFGVGIGISRLVRISQQAASKARSFALSEEMNRESARIFGQLEARKRRQAEVLRARRSEALDEAIRAAAMARPSYEALEAWRESESRGREIDSIIEAAEDEADVFRQEAERRLRLAVYSAAKRRKYERVGRYPWLPIPPDPPPP